MKLDWMNLITTLAIVVAGLIIYDKWVKGRIKK